MENTQLTKRVLLDTDVYTGEKIVKDIIPRLCAVFEEGALSVVYEEEYSTVATELMQELKKHDYRVFALKIERGTLAEEQQIDMIPDYIRYAFAVGSDVAQSVAKRISATSNIGWSLLWCAPTNDEIMCGNSPNEVFIDKNILINCTNEQLASGYGILLSAPFRAFENHFSKKVLAINSVEETPHDKCCADVSELAFSLLKLSSVKHTSDSAEIMSEVLADYARKKGKRPRAEGEYRFLASCLIASFYKAFLGAPSIDAVPPACASDEADLLEELTGKKRNKAKCVDFFDTNGYFRIGYILSEYRMDLLEKLASVDVHGMQRFWRRLYDDAGYWLKGEITATELLKCLKLAAAQSDGLLGYAYASGIMKNFG